MPKMLSPHFSLDELVFSQTAARRGLDNTPDAPVLRNLTRLAAALEEVRSALGGVAILISSGYRSPAVNRAVGGAKSSAHISGLAADFTAPSFGTVLQTARAVAKSGIAFDQIIFEYGRWVHLGIAADPQAPESQLLSILRPGKYVPGLTTLA